MEFERVRAGTHEPRHSGLYLRAIVILIAGNTLLAGVKGLLAFMTGSSAIFSDAASSLSDIFYSMLLGIGLYLAQKPADESHPQGHIRFDPLASLFVTLVMAGAGITAAYQSILRFMGGARSIELALPTIVLMGAALVKVGMFTVLSRTGNDARSPAIRASAQDNLADILTSLGALVGIWGAHYIHPLLDPTAGIAVALWIFRTIRILGKENIGYLTGRGASSEMIEQITEKAYAVEGVKYVHRVIADYVGPQLRVDIHVTVDGTMTLDQAHEITEKVRENLEALLNVDLVFIHVEPYHKG